MESLGEETMLAEKCHFSNILLFLSFFFIFSSVVLLLVYSVCGLGSTMCMNPHKKQRKTTTNDKEPLLGWLQ